MAAKQQLEAAPHGARETSGRRGLLGRTRGRVRIDSVVPDEAFRSRASAAATRVTRHGTAPTPSTRRGTKNQNNLFIRLAKLRHDGVLPREQLLPVVQDLRLLLVEVAEVRPAPVDVLGLEGHLGQRSRRVLATK